MKLAQWRERDILPFVKGAIFARQWDGKKENKAATHLRQFSKDSKPKGDGICIEQRAIRKTRGATRVGRGKYP